MGAMILPAALRHGTITQPGGLALAHGLDAKVCRDTNGCIVRRGVGLVSRHNAPWAAIQTRRRSTMTRVAASATRRAVHAAGIESRYNFLYRDRGATTET